MTGGAIAAADIDWEARRAVIDRARAILARGAGKDATTALAIDCALAAVRDPAVAAFVEARLGLSGRADASLWRGLGIGVCRATLLPDGTWEPFADGDVPREAAGRGVPAITIPVVAGGGDLASGAAIEIFAVELEPGRTARATGRVYALTGLAIGLGLESFVYREWRAWSTSVALVADPLAWVRAHRAISLPGQRTDKEAFEAIEKLRAERPDDPLLRDPESHPEPSGPSGDLAAILGDLDSDGRPALWLADLDPDQRVGEPDAKEWAWRQGETDRFLLAATPIVGDCEATAIHIARRVAAARRRATPKSPEIGVWAPDAAPGEAATGEAA